MAFTLQIGESAPDFNLPGVDGQNYSLDSFKDARVLVIAWSCNHCPYVIGSEDRMKQFFDTYSIRGVALSPSTPTSRKITRLIRSSTWWRTRARRASCFPICATSRRK
jgi:peroxiredoxin